MKAFIPLLLLLLVSSFLCFHHPSFHSYSDWALFVILFGTTMLGVFFFVKPNLRPKRKGKEKREQSILEALHEGVILFDKQGKILRLNRVAESILGVNRKEAVSQSFSQLAIATNSLILDHCAALVERCLQSGTLQSLSFCLDQDKKKCRDIFAKPLAQKDQYLLLLQDSSPQYQMQQVGKDFVANASHELRTPITIIKGFAETLQDLPEISEAMLEDFVEKIVRNCHRMDSLVKNLLTLTDLDYLPKARIQECDLVGLMDNCIHTLLAVHKDVEIEAFHNQEIITIFADPDLLELAFMNLLENAVKYSSSPAIITITIEDLPEKARLSIADKGVGIPEDDVDHIFDRFYTVDKAHSRRLGGAGLGLSIVKTIVKKHEGSIAVSSKKGEGTTFTLNFQKAHELVL